ncbi:glycosyltransferase [Georgenia sp. SYP-B2076]|uniref:glycosyltransferase n=1 Tax=Georgenia sp. SYP-B2076 TaxID=2495881 RepID=UPI000F8F509A|nr:glycosyltransferase [Georgenia sp. SYP-B2076]
MSTTATDIAREQAASKSPYRVVQRVILPLETDSDAIPLYVDAGASAIDVRRTDVNALWEGKDDAESSTNQSGESVRSSDFRGRFSTSVRPSARLSFGTYFNAFAASYWRRWTTVESVRLEVAVAGTGTLIVYRSNAKGAQQRVESVAIGGKATHVLDLPLKPFGDGGWYWFDLIGGAEGAVLQHAHWAVPDADGKRGRTSLAVTTFNRPDYCLRTIQDVWAAETIREVLDELIIVDQGTQNVVDEDGFDEVAAAMGGKLRIVRQGNIGGSGGFSRGMYETVQAGRSDYVILLDDDIVLEPESITRLVAFADFTRRPTLVGGHMFDMYNRSVLHTFGETLDPWRFQPRQAHEDMSLGHDLARSNLRTTPWLHRRADVDYNGWWMTLIPTSVIREIGLSLPLFIKWDDAEYSLRASKAGYPTVSLPGSAVWHISWLDKDDLVGWQAYFHERNRVIVTLLHSLYERGGRVIRESTYMDIKHLISMQYYSEQGRLQALRDVLKGPDHLHDIIGVRLGEIRKMTAEFTDAQLKPDVDAFPAPRRQKPRNKGRGVRLPSRITLGPWAAKTVLRQTVLPVKHQAKDNPQVLIPHQDARWWRLSQYDSAVVSNAEGTGASWYKRDPRKVRVMLTEALDLHRRLLAEWPRLRKQYQDAAPRLVSFEAWEETFRRNAVE